MPAVRSSASAGSTSPSFFVSKPTGTTAGDLIIGFQYDSSANPTPPGTFSFLASFGSGPAIACFYKTAGSFEPAAYQFNNTGNVGSVGYTISVSSAPSAPEGSTGTSSPSSTTSNTGSYSTATNNELLLAAYGYDNTGSFTMDAALTSLGFQTDSATCGMNVGWATQVSAGASGPYTASSGGMFDWLNMIISIAIPGAVGDYFPSWLPPRILNEEEFEYRRYR